MHHVVFCHLGGPSASFSMGSQSQGSPKGDLCHCVHSSVKGEFILLFSVCTEEKEGQEFAEVLGKSVGCNKP